jgi:alpha-1,2-mannosyltransferase
MFLRRLRLTAVATVTISLFAVAPIVLLASLAQMMVGPSPKAWPHALDFHMFWLAARVFAHGRSPYPPPHHWVISGSDQSFFYLPSTAAMLTPFAPLSYHAASALFVLVLALAVAGALWLLDVRDWRCYGAAFASPAVFTAVSLGSITPLLLLGAAATWRWRNRAVLLGVVVGLTVVAKLILWPLVIWLWFTGRRRSAGVSVGTAAAACVASWAWIGFADLGRYPSLLRHAEAVEGPNGYGIFWRLGGGSGTYLVVAAVAALVVGLVARRRGNASGFVAAILASLVATPQLWLHYLALLVAVFAVLRPRLDAVWLLPLILWVTPYQQPGDHSWRVVVFSSVVALTAAAAVRSAPRHEARQPSLSAAV